MKNKKTIIISIIVVIFLILVSFGLYILTREDKNTTLSIIDKQWIEANKNKLYDIAVVNNVPVLNYKGEGVFFDFISKMEEDTKLDFNPISYNYGVENENEYAFKVTRKLSDNDITVLKDHYVLVSNNKNKYNNLNMVTNVKIGILKSDAELIHKYINTDVSFVEFDTVTELFDNITKEEKTIDLIAVPRMAYLQNIISNDSLNIVYNITDLQEYYVLTLGSNDKLNTIIKKYYTKWSKDYYNDSYNKYLNKNYFTFKGIDETTKAKLKSKNYVYGFVNNPPYDVLNQDKLIGVNSSLIKSFASLTGAELEIKKYKSIDSLLQAFNENNLDFVFNNYSSADYKMDVYNTTSSYDEKIVIISNINNNITVNSINSVLDNEISVVADTKIEQILSENGNKVKKYNNLTELVSEINRNSIIAIDFLSYTYLSKTKLKDFKVDYEFTIDHDYNYTMRDIKDNQLFNEYFNFYLSFVNETEYINNSYVKLFAIKEDNNYNQLLILLCLIIIILLSLIVSLKKKTFKKEHKKRNIVISKTDKLKYIDVLTSLKNRNYLNDHIDAWDENEVYPQAVVIVDLNNVAYINDNYGHQEGDNVIKEAANILIKNQIQNTEIIRTNGNEFLIYMIGYEEKQVVSFIRKITRELKDLAHGFGAATGYSIISDAIKTVDDAINEATLDMKNNKEELNN